MDIINKGKKMYKFYQKIIKTSKKATTDTPHCSNRQKKQSINVKPPLFDEYRLNLFFTSTELSTQLGFTHLLSF